MTMIPLKEARKPANDGCMDGHPILNPNHGVELEMADKLQPQRWFEVGRGMPEDTIEMGCHVIHTFRTIFPPYLNLKLLHPKSESQ